MAKRKNPAAQERGLGETLVLLGFPGVFVVAGLVLLWAGSAEWRHARASASWPTTPGIVEKSYSVLDRRTRSVHIVYTYEVGAVPYRSGRVAFGSHSPAAGRRWLRDYPVGASVPVYFNPEDPATSVLEPRLIEGNWVMPSFGALFLAAGCLMGRFFWRNARR
jgi:Protein of unknown function (DUF3592)